MARRSTARIPRRPRPSPRTPGLGWLLLPALVAVVWANGSLHASENAGGRVSVEVTVAEDGWRLRRIGGGSGNWTPDRSLDAGCAFVAAGPGLDGVALTPAVDDLMGGRVGTVHLRADDAVPWRQLQRTAGLLQIDERPGRRLVVDARPLAQR